jgi:alanyl-tRNA synthetase
VFPEIAQRVEHVQTLLEAEEAAFGKTLGRGLVRFEELAKKTKGGRLGGAESFDLYATYGFPKDLVELMARERELAFDEEGWTKAEKEHQAASRSEGKFKRSLSSEQQEQLAGRRTRSSYHDEGDTGYELDTAVEWAVPGGDAGRAATEFESTIVLRDSPFYVESGGQASDTGVIEARDGSFTMQVREVERSGDIVLHRGTVTTRAPHTATSVLSLMTNAAVRARVDKARRDDTRKNHTATHLLHKALKLVLGEHVAQQGSYVGPDRLRFDFSHPRAVTPDELDEIERIVNERVFENAPVTHQEMGFAEAKARGAIAMFGEKYGERVKVLDVGGWSIELCGGTHVRATGDIGPFVIVSESAIQAGVRRIEAVTGPAAVAAIQRQRRVLRESSALLKTGERDLPARIQALQESVKELKRGQQKSKSDFGKLAQDLVQGAERVGESLVIAEQLEGVDGSELSKLIPLLQTSAKSICGVLGLVAEEKPVLSVFASKDLGGERVDSAAIVNELAPLIGGRGGGSATLARAGGKTADKLGAAIAKGGELLRSALTAS